MKASILIPTYNRSDLLVKTLAGLSKLAIPAGVQPKEIEIVVIANACTDDTVEVAKQFAMTSPFSFNVVVEESPGLNMARNRAVKEARSDILAFIDDDVLVAKDWLVNLLASFERLPAQIIGGRVRLWWEEVNEPDWFGYHPVFKVLLSELDLGDSDVEASDEGTYGIGANIAFRREVFDKVGEFKPELDRKGTSLLGGGETELCARARAAGCRQFFVPSVSVKHWVASKRVSLDYICGVATGMSESDVRRHNQGLPKTFHYTKVAKASLRLCQRAFIAKYFSLLGQEGAYRYNLVKLFEAKGIIRGSFRCLGYYAGT